MIKQLLTDPLSVALGVGAAVGHALGIKWVVAVTGAVWTQVGTLFTAISISSYTLAPELGWLPEGPLQAVALTLGAMYVLKLILSSAGRIDDRLDS